MHKVFIETSSFYGKISHQLVLNNNKKNSSNNNPIFKLDVLCENSLKTFFKLLVVLNPAPFLQVNLKQQAENNLTFKNEC